ncbi:single-stranded DNA-binding protein [bacterium]|nr:single-stranded DNA-binding protein [bacterium]
MELNKVLLIGNLTRDPETRFLQSGSQVCKLGLASNRRWRGRDGNQGEETLFIDVDAWGKTAELCGQYLRKGSQILVEGRLKMDQYQTSSGENRTKYVIVADRVQFGARSEGSQGGGGPRQQSGGGGQSSGSGWGSSHDSSPNSSDSAPSHEETEDDLPF